MFWSITRHEIAYRLRTLSTHVYFLLFLGLSSLIVNASAGAFGESVSFSGPGGESIHANAPTTILALIVLFTLFGTIITAAIFGQAIYRDYESGIHPLTFTMPVSKWRFLGGRFAGAFVVNLYIFTGVGLGLAAGEITPWLDADQFGAFRPLAYLQPYAVFVLPNLLFTGAIFFGLAATTRKMLPNYMGGILLFVGYLTAGVLLEGNPVQEATWAALLDPFGLTAFGEVTRYWTVAEQNAQLVPIRDLVVYNRLLWVGVGLALLAVLSVRFRFEHVSEGGGSSSNEADGTTSGTVARMRPSALLTAIDLPGVQPNVSWTARLVQTGTLARRAFLTIVRDVYFYAIALAGVIYLIVGANNVGSLSGTTVEPVTRIVANELGSGLFLFVVILIVFYAGRLVWRERDLKVQPILDTLPLPSSLLFIAKGIALVGMVVVLQALVMATGLTTQAVLGYTRFEIGLYVTELLGLDLLRFSLLCVFALTVHTIVNHKYIGHFVLILYFVSLPFLPELGLEHPLVRYLSNVGTSYSDINGYGAGLTSFTWMALHWGGVTLIMALGARLFWVRGNETTLRARWQQARSRFTRPMQTAVAGAVVLVLGTGTVAYYNLNVLHAFRTSNEQQALTAAYETTYGHLDGAPQPRITAVVMDVDLFPKQRDATMAGRYTLVNKTGRPIDSLYVNTVVDDELRIEEMTFDRAATPVVIDDTLGFRTYALDASLLPRDTMALHVRKVIDTRGFGGSMDAVVQNGTFLNSGMLPSIGYQPGAELSGRGARETHDLPPKPRMPPRSDTSAWHNSYTANDADWIDFEATVSTSAGQVPLAPGRLDSTWTSGGRRHAHYSARPPMKNFYTFLSSAYDEQTSRWRPADTTASRPSPVEVSVYHHPAHDFNIDRMMAGAQAALTYYTQHFGPYQNDHLRIAEFPRTHGRFAQSFLGTVPFSEGFGFILRFDEESDIDFPFYVTAHEVAHQWWGHQVTGANVRGAMMISETLSQYSALMVMKERYGPRAMRRFLEFELDKYLRGRGQESRRERPLVTTAGQQYIHYRKGSVTMYALQDYIGEAQVNRALRQFVQEEAFTGPPYPTTHDLMAHVESVTPDSLRYILDDWFRDITLHENRITEAVYTPTEDGRYRVTLDVTPQKVKLDSTGTPRDAPMNDWIDIGVFASDADVDAQNQRVLYLKKHRLQAGEQTVTVTVDATPARAGIDPYVKLIDRDVEDNVTRVSPQSDGGPNP